MEGIEMKNYFFCVIAVICLIAGGVEMLQAKDQMITKITGIKPQSML
jgi:hypothetical protein